MIKILVVYGTRPELIKLASFIKKAKLNKSIKLVVCSTGQHKEMLESLHQAFDIQPDYDFQLMKPNQNLSELHSDIMKKMSEVIKIELPNWIIVQGDTSTAHAAAVTGFYSKVKVAHIEAGLRTYDIYSPFPEELNRRVIGLIANKHYAPTQEAAQNLLNEKNNNQSTVEVTGNTGIDSLLMMSELLEDPSRSQKLKDKYQALLKKEFILVTMHRRENFGEAQKKVLTGLLKIVQKHNINIIFPVHPNPNIKNVVEQQYESEMGRSVCYLDDGSLNNEAGQIFLTTPVDYADLVYLLKKCKFVMTDSGGIQEEAPSFKKPILVLRSSTERPEGVAAGFAKLVGTDEQEIIKQVEKIFNNQFENLMDKKNPYGQGHASEKIINSLLS